MKSLTPQPAIPFSHETSPAWLSASQKGMKTVPKSVSQSVRRQINVNLISAKETAEYSLHIASQGEAASKALVEPAENSKFQAMLMQTMAAAAITSLGQTPTPPFPTNPAIKSRFVLPVRNANTRSNRNIADMDNAKFINNRLGFTPTAIAPLFNAVTISPASASRNKPKIANKSASGAVAMPRVNEGISVARVMVAEKAVNGAVRKR